ncbi:nucleoside recognition domain-containing protein, partial [Actinotalea sp.]|uniref:nucleoside recognition domain-containing protein n=1 Tax=Actinotalea sp. TaxID=1872145 RepID=UPI0035620C97
RLPVYLLLTGLLVPDDARWGPFGLQGLALFALYLLGGVSAMVVASVLRATVLRRGGLPFYLELPPFRVPTARSVVQSVWAPVRVFLRKVGTIILLANLVLWALLTFPDRSAETEAMAPAEAAAYTLDHSYAATVGKAVEPVFDPLGFDWRINIGLVSAMAAREVFVSTLGQVAAAQDPENPQDVLRTMTFTDGERAGEPVFTAPTIVALLVYFVFAMQCVSTLAVMRRESNSWRWPAFSFVSLTALAWVAAWLARAVTQLVI